MKDNKIFQLAFAIIVSFFSVTTYGQSTYVSCKYNPPTNLTANYDTDNNVNLSCGNYGQLGVGILRVHYQRNDSSYQTPTYPYSNIPYIDFDVSEPVILNSTTLPFPKNYRIFATYVVDPVNGAEEITPCRESYASNEIYYDTPPAQPAAPTVTLISDGTGNVVLNYINVADPTSDVFGYFIMDTSQTVVAFDPDGTAGAANSVKVNGLHPGQSYYFQIYALDQFGNLSAPSPQSNIVVGPGYCAPTDPQTGCSDRQNSYIQQVILTCDPTGGTSFTYPASADTTPDSLTYHDYTYKATNNPAIPRPILQQGTTNNTLSITAMANGTRNTNMYVFIDYNFDGRFDKDTEMITYPSLAADGSSQMTSGTPITFLSDNFTVPTTSFVANQVMRMRIMYERFQLDPINGMWPIDEIETCELMDLSNTDEEESDYWGYGEIQDFTVDIIADPTPSPRIMPKATVKTEVQPVVENVKEETETAAVKPNPLHLKLYPNPVSGDSMTITEIEDNTPYTIFSQKGIEVGSGKVTNGSINVANLKSDKYILRIETPGHQYVKNFIKQ